MDRTFGWLRGDWRLDKDYERKVQISEMLIEVAMIRLLLQPLKVHPGGGRHPGDRNALVGGDPAALACPARTTSARLVEGGMARRPAARAVPPVGAGLPHWPAAVSQVAAAGLAVHGAGLRLHAVVLSGVVALTWGILRTVLVILALRMRDTPIEPDAPNKTGCQSRRKDELSSACGLVVCLSFG